MTLLRLASAAEGRAILEAEDDFTRALGSFDRSFRMRTTAPVEDADLRRYLGEQALDFSSDEARAWDEAMTILAHGAKGLRALLPAEVVLVKTTGHEERDHAYTRANAIIVPAARARSWRGERAYRFLAHELFHIATRHSSKLRDETYALLGFERLATPLAPPLDDCRLTNPDAHELAHSLKLEDGRAFVPLLICSHPLADVLDRATVLGPNGAVEAMLLEIDPVAGAPMSDSQGEPLLVKLESTTWSQRIGRNSSYTIHPEEVLADNLALLIRRRLGKSPSIPDASFAAAFESAIEQSTG